MALSGIDDGGVGDGAGAGGEVALIVIVAFEPWFTAPPVQTVTGLGAATAACRRTGWSAGAETMSRPAGTVSTTLTPVALAVPMLLTVRV